MSGWFTALQSAGIVGSLVFTGVQLRQSRRATVTDNTLRLMETHRDIWARTFDHPELSRALDPARAADALSPEERLFIRLLLLHLGATLQASRKGSLPEPAHLDDDIKDFFEIPSVRYVWSEERTFMDPWSVERIQRVLGDSL